MLERISTVGFFLFTCAQLSCAPQPLSRGGGSMKIGGKSATDSGVDDSSKGGISGNASKAAAEATKIFSLSNVPMKLRCQPPGELDFLPSEGLTSKNTYLLSRFAMIGGEPLPFNAESLPNWLKKGSFEEVKLLENSAKGVQGFVAQSAKINLVVFRGTHSTQGALTDVKFIVQSASPDSMPGGVHRGFKDAYQTISDSLNTALRSEKYKMAPTYFVGHSLGGALALLAALDAHAKGTKVAGVVTLGQPRVGNLDFALAAEKTLTGKYMRFVYANDPVAHLPPSGSSGDEALGALFDSGSNTSIISIPGVTSSLSGIVFALAKFTHIGKPERLADAEFSRSTFDSDSAWDQRYWTMNKEKVRQAVVNPTSALESSIVAEHGVENYLCEILSSIR